MITSTRCSRLRTCGENGWRTERTKLSLFAVMAGIVCLGAVLSPLGARAEVIQIFYDSFETPDVATASSTVLSPGWMESNSYSGMWDIDWGPNWVSTAYGRQGLRCWNESYIQTTAITEKLQPGATYTLTFNVGNVNVDTGKPRNGHGFNAYILAGTNIVGSVSGTTSTNTLTQTSVVSLTTTGSHPDLGKTLGIRLRDDGNSSYTFQTLFDNVRLVVEETSDFTQTMFYGK